MATIQRNSKLAMASMIALSCNQYSMPASVVIAPVNKGFVPSRSTQGNFKRNKRKQSKRK